MVGHYLLTLSAEQEDRVLTEHFSPALSHATGCCLVMLMTRSAHVTECESRGENWCERQNRLHRAGERWAMLGRFDAAFPYEVLCSRFGAARVNAAIRNRILSNRARQVLSRETVVAGAELEQVTT